ncbi:MAG: hypothetical protein ACOX2O_01490 [Bdellovibrionota bacterium]|jgi:hypothetical protein
MLESTIFSSDLYTPPDITCSYFRDGLPPPLTRDFIFLGALLSNWQSASDVIYLAYKIDTPSYDGSFIFKDAANHFIHPLSGEVFEGTYSDFQLRAVPYHELRRFFISRFYQYRILQDRKKTRPQTAMSYNAGAEEVSTLQDEWRHAEECYYALDATIECRSFQTITNDSTPPANSVYCIKDGWVEPYIADWIGNDKVGVRYLLCPCCMGNIDYDLIE